MTGIWTLTAAVCAAEAMWLKQWRPVRVPADLAPAGRVRELPLPLVLEMLSVAIRQGSSIPRALIAVGDIAAGDFGAGLRSAGEQLNKGVSWDDAWPDDGDLAVVRDAFASSWHSGASPVERLETAVEQLDWDERSQIEQAAAKLSVRLLLPTGLCFLPAFVAVGIIPAVMSFVGMTAGKQRGKYGSGNVGNGQSSKNGVLWINVDDTPWLWITHVLRPQP